ncbi:MAG: hypothetical protein ACHQ50_14920 [Fimbriimonadales bacterium]
MIGLAVAWVLIGGSNHGKRVASVLGEWCAWRITSGDVLVSPPQLATGRLVLKSDGTFRWHLEESGSMEDSKGTYRVRGHNLIVTGDTVLSKAHGTSGARTRMPIKFTLIHRGRQLWDDSYIFGGGSFVFSRPGRRPVVPHSENDWPSLRDVLRG